MRLSRMHIEEGFVHSRFGRTWYRMVGNSKKTPLICLHGGPGAAHDMLKPLEYFASDRPVVLYDQIGCGRSAPLPAANWKVETFVTELEVLRRSLGIKTFHLLGHSWGSMFGVDYCLKYPHHVSTAIFSSPCLSTKLWIQDAKALIKKLPLSAQRALQHAEKSGEYRGKEYTAACDLFMAKHCLRLKKKPAYIAHTGVGFNYAGYLRMWGPSEFRATGSLKNFDRLGQLGNLKMPSLFTCGEHDESTPETVRRYADAVTNSKFKVVTGASHLPMYENPKMYFSTIKNFLTGFDE